MTRLDFDKIIDNPIVISMDAENFDHIEDYKDLWEKIVSLLGYDFDFTNWKGEIIDDQIIKMQLSFKDKTWHLEFGNGFFNSTFFDEINKILHELGYNKKRFCAVSPEGVEYNGGELNVIYEDNEIIQLLDENGYGEADPKWFGC